MSKPFLKTALRIVLLATLLLAMTACGQKGDLVRPGTPAPAAVSASAAIR